MFGGADNSHWLAAISDDGGGQRYEWLMVVLQYNIVAD